jgi:hypothetical protein
MRWLSALGLVLVALVSACGDDDNSSSSATPSLTATSVTPTPAATPVGTEIQRGADGMLGDLVIVVETGCWGCDGPPSGLFRAYGHSGGSGAAYQWLLRTGPSGVTDVNDNVLSDGHIVDIVSTPDLSVMAVSICVQGTCVLDGLDSFDPASITATFRSFDGGVTWAEIDRRGPVADAAGVMDDGRALISNALDGQGTSVEYVLMPDSTSVVAPPEAHSPVVAADAVLWATSDGRLLGPDGTVLVGLPDAAPGYPVTLVGSVTGEKSSAVLQWYGGDQASPGYAYIAELSPGKDTTDLYTEQIVYLGGWLPKRNQAVISIDGQGPQPYPALLDMSTGEFSVITNPFNGGESVDADTGRDIVVGAAEGPFVEVKGTDSCLNVRAEPSMSGEVRTCVYDHGILQYLGDTQTAEGSDWLRVMTLTGTQGWVSKEFLWSVTLPVTP